MTSPWHYLDTLPKGVPIAWDRAEGLWQQVLGKLITRTGQLLHSPRCVRAGRRVLFIGRIQQRYGVTTAEAQRLLIASEHQDDDPWYTGGSSRYATLEPNLLGDTSPAPLPQPSRQLETR